MTPTRSAKVLRIGERHAVIQLSFTLFYIGIAAEQAVSPIAARICSQTVKLLIFRKSAKKSRAAPPLRKTVETGADKAMRYKSWDLRFQPAARPSWQSPVNRLLSRYATASSGDRRRLFTGLNIINFRGLSSPIRMALGAAQSARTHRP